MVEECGCGGQEQEQLKNGGQAERVESHGLSRLDDSGSVAQLSSSLRTNSSMVTNEKIKQM